MQCEMQSVYSRFELVSPCPFPTTITITPQAPPVRLVYDLRLSNRVHCTFIFIFYVVVFKRLFGHIPIEYE